MNKIFVALLAISLLYTSAHAADKIRIGLPADAGTLHISFGAEKRVLKRGGI